MYCTILFRYYVHVRNRFGRCHRLIFIIFYMFMFVAWTCHEGGAACVAWAGGSGALVSCGRRGDVLVWDLRARAVRHRGHAHHAPIKCVALSPREDHYAIGAADGDIKVSYPATYYSRDLRERAQFGTGGSRTTRWSNASRCL